MDNSSSTRIQNNSSIIVVRNKRTKRQERKAIERRSVLTAVANDEIVNRQLITNDELEHFLLAIVRNNICIFSIGKLANLLINEIYIPSSVLSSTIYNDHYKDLEDKYCQQITLLDASCYHNRDNITLALIRSGAMPPFHCININCYKDKIHHIQKKLLDPSLNPSFLVWVIQNYFQFNIGINHNNDITCEKCLSNNAILHLQPCNHHICQLCYWDSFLNRSPFDDMCCPIDQCKRILNYKHDTLSIVTNNSHHVIDQAEKIASESFEKWLKLPEFITEDGNDSSAGQLTKMTRAEKLKQKAFQALPMCILQEKLIGTLRSKRCEEFHKAAIQNNWKRLEIIIAAGVDINCVNEYGQSTLFIATSKKNYESMRILLLSGASELIKDNAGYLASDVANYFNDEIALSILEHRIFSEAYHLYNTLPEKHDKVGNVTTLIPVYSELKGAGSYMIDDCFDETFLNNLECLFKALPIAPAEKKSCSHRSYYCDSIGWIRMAIAKVLRDKSLRVTNAFAEMRFLHYEYVGGSLPVHVDLSRKDGQISSTHTFILYLQTCSEGGETILYDNLYGCHETGVELARVHPRRGRLFLFPHVCPHSGAKTIEIPKLLLRGELY
jgi:hypothetical protein